MVTRPQLTFKKAVKSERLMQKIENTVCAIKIFYKFSKYLPNSTCALSPQAEKIMHECYQSPHFPQNVMHRTTLLFNLLVNLLSTEHCSLFCKLA